MAMETSLKLGEIFNNRIFRVPDYQRGYAWGERQLVEFWEDLEDLAPQNRHYTGSIFIEESNQIDTQDEWLVKAGYEKCDIVDGQQRLTTIVLLLNELISRLSDGQGYNEVDKRRLQEQYLFRESLSKNSRSYIFNYSASDPNYAFISNHVFRDNTQIDRSESNAYAQNLLAAKIYFQGKVEGMDHQDRENLFSKITKCLAFDLRKMDKCLKVEAVFEVMNNRGKKLTILERLKNRLVYLTGFINAEEYDRNQLRTCVNDAWKKVYQFLAKNPENILDEDDFFISHLSMYADPKESVFSYETAEDKIFKMFSTRPERSNETAVTYHKIKDYLLSLANAVTEWYEIHNSKNNQVKKILIMSSLRDIKVFLLALFCSCEDSPKRQKIIANLESAMFRNRVPGLWVFDERALATIARELYSEERAVDDVLAYIQDLCNSHIDNANLINGIQNLFSYQRGNLGYHRWGSLKYLLYGYDDFLRQKFQEQDMKLSYDSYDENTIEHILPRNWKANWSGFFPEADGIDHDELGKIICNSLGNLTILRGGKNSSLSDASWEIKKGRYRSGSYNEIDISHNSSWTMGTITRRGLDLLAFMESRITGLHLTDSEKMTLLFCRDETITYVRQHMQNNENSRE